MARQAISEVRGVPVVTSLPASPNDGMEIYYRFTPTVTPADTTPITWHLYYDLATTAWYPIGRQEPVMAMRSTSVADTVTFGAGAWGNPPNDPFLIVPRAGDYIMDLGVDKMWNSAAGNWYFGVMIAGVAPSATGVEPTDNSISIPGVSTFSAGRGQFKKTFAAGITLTTMWYFSSSNVLSAYTRWIQISPRKITG